MRSTRTDRCAKRQDDEEEGNADLDSDSEEEQGHGKCQKQIYEEWASRPRTSKSRSKQLETEENKIEVGKEKRIGNGEWDPG